MHIFEIIFQRLKNKKVSKNNLWVPAVTPPLPKGCFSGQVASPLFFASVLTSIKWT